MISFNYFFILIIIGDKFLINNAQNVNKNVLCNSKETCGECIQEDGCVWCSKFLKPSDPETSNFTRCIAESEKTQGWCPENLINNPNPELNIIKDLPLNSATNPVIQIRPQKVQLKLRRNQKYKLHFQYAQAVDYPVDLYYLMDLSNSMADDRENLSNLGDKLADAMRKLTKNFRLGFGSFVEKVTMPFVSTVPERLQKPCSANNKCTAPYSYINHLPLDSNTSRFTEEVKKASVSGNLDSPEGGFDAILQSIVCKKEVGWRETATRLLVFSTDAKYHLAGDGKLAGIVQPSDGRCYLNEKGEFTHALMFDYPSISFINRHVKKNNIDLLFAVTKNVEETYRNLATRIAGSQVEILDNDSKNVVRLVSDVYKKLKQTVEITDNAGPDIHIEYSTACLEGKEIMPTKKCNDIRYNKKVDFYAEIRATSCQNKKHTIEIKPRSLSESLVIELEVQCDCDCEQPGHHSFEPNSQYCNSSGSLTCGVCTCNSGRLGKFCECVDDSGLLSSVDMNSCKKTNKTEEPVCSGRGRCKCGKCICDKGRRSGEEYSGTYCQCDNFSCKKPNNKMCSGHGTCECRQCNCDPDFTGSACECDLRNVSCIEPGKTDICSGKGECVCGECVCQKQPMRYSGRYCQMCSECPGQRCSEFVDCVECQTFPNTGKYSKEECNFHCTNFTTIPMNDIEMIDNATSDNIKVCEHIDNNGCTMLFKYYIHDINKETSIPKVYVQNEKKCPAKVELLPIMILVIGTIVLAGIILLAIWKIVTEVHDRHEYARFEKERQNAKWDRGENPLYKNPTTTTNNPLFGES